jgi:hypothetical protein
MAWALWTGTGKKRLFKGLGWVKTVGYSPFMENRSEKWLIAVWRWWKVVVIGSQSIITSLKRATILPYVFKGAPMPRMMPSRRIERISSLVKHPLPRSVYIFACSNMHSSCPTSKSLLGRSASTREGGHTQNLARHQKYLTRRCWTNIVSTLLLLGIRSLNALLAHSIAVNTSYRSSLGITNPSIQALIALDLVIRRKWGKLTFSFYSLVGSVLIQSYQSEYSHKAVLIDWHLDTHKVRLIISGIQINPCFEES